MRDVWSGLTALVYFGLVVSSLFYLQEKIAEVENSKQFAVSSRR